MEIEKVGFVVMVREVVGIIVEKVWVEFVVVKEVIGLIE